MARRVYTCGLHAFSSLNISQTTRTFSEISKRMNLFAKKTKIPIFQLIKRSIKIQKIIKMRSRIGRRLWSAWIALFKHESSQAIHIQF
jgi:hypothetical protein